MDRQSRLEAARERMGRTRALLVTAREAGPPCRRCTHYRYFEGSSAICGHPAYLESAFSPATGKLEMKSSVKAEAARSGDGMCGPEAALFERIPLKAWLALAVFAVPAYLTVQSFFQ